MDALPAIQGRHNQSGFTLVELVSVMIVVGILAATVLPRFFGTHGFEERGFYDETISALRYAQKSAIAQRRLVCVEFTDTTVTLRYASGSGATVCGPYLAGPSGQIPYVIDAGDRQYRNANIQFSAVPGMLSFDGLGRPSAAATITIANFPTSITVHAETGYVH